MAGRSMLRLGSTLRHVPVCSHQLRVPSSLLQASSLLVLGCRHMSDRPMRVVIVQPHAGSSQETFEALEEAEGLVEAVQGWRVIGSEIIKVKRPGSRTYLGDGQCAKLGKVINTLAGGGELQEEGRAKEDALAEAEAEWDETEKERLEEELGPCSVFVNTKSLAPHQQQHLQDEWGVPVLDRFMVVLQIFKNRATSAEATIQLELAELAFRRSRLSAIDAGYSQQRGGTATRGGGGEQQIELSRRTLLRRETLLKKELARAVESRAKRDSVIREREINLGSRLSRVALVGYTNAGKSLLHQRLTALAPRERAQDALFASLDTCTRVGHLPGVNAVLFVDTVGFIKDLAHSLVRCFNATLEEAVHCDVLVHVIDVSNRAAYAQKRSVEQTLADLGTLPPVSHRIDVYNKSDRLSAKERLCWEESEAAAEGTTRILCSALKSDGIERLQAEIARRLQKSEKRASRSFELPYLERPAVVEAQLSFLYGHPKATVLGTRVSPCGEKLLVDCEMDDTSYQVFTGRSWQQDESTAT